ncbi:hypothetical protein METBISCDRAFT_17103 [Metschnikowia bicuspidata]|uniref:BAH-domain-containing protein n=1 Tax=Metschnikowia bicuspidata TaxID=27322 RepID=A0A4P9ZB88_9ASCO|nr:hypothetical protein METBISCDRAFT_17103 [Metschnikowia bicuspidata]
MTQERPKRKATANKNYLDFISDSALEANRGTPTKGRARGKNGGNGGVTGTSMKNNRAATKLPINWIPPVEVHERFSHKLNLSDAYIDLETQTLTCPNQPQIDVKEIKTTVRNPKGVFQLKKGDFIYMVSEPPGDPYYIGRLMGFNSKRRKDANNTATDVAPNYEFLIQWFYRPRDISKNTLDSRLLYASMHSDTCPITSFRGLVTVKHKLEVEKFYVPKLYCGAGEALSAVEYYSLLPNCFYFDKLFDRYMIKFYDIIRTTSLLEYLDNEANSNRNYILALNKRYEYVFMEAARTKVFLNNFTSTMSTHCKICAEWCPLAESVTCSECGYHYHMLCLDPPLLKKPSRGFSWTCAPCLKKREMEQLAKKTLMLSHDNKTTNEDEICADSYNPELADPLDGFEPVIQRNLDDLLPKYEKFAIAYLKNDSALTVAERRLKEEWNIRYLGIHCRLEDAVDPDDRSPYPRASTSLGPKYQATNIPEFEGHPIVYYDADKNRTEKDKKGTSKKGSKKKLDSNVGKLLQIPPEYKDVLPKDYPQWLQPCPKGYIERGVDDGYGQTCTLLWKSLEADIADDFAKHDMFVALCVPFAQKLGLHPNSPNFMDAIVKIHLTADGDTTKALAAVKKLTLKTLKEPQFSKDETRRFEAGVRKYGSELYPIYKEVKTQSSAAIVRFYYLWKKTKNGQAIWQNFPGRKKRKNKNSEMKVVTAGDAFADSDDDSSYENDKIVGQKKLFECRHCRLYVSEAWYKVTGSEGVNRLDSSLDALGAVDTSTILALCFRCAKLWRRYAVYWEDPLEVERKSSKGVGGYKRKVELELVADAERILLYAELIKAVLSPETPKSKISCSVITESVLFKNSLPLQTAQPKNEYMDVVLSKSTSPTTLNGVLSDSAPRLTAIQLALSAKGAVEEKIPEPTKKKRKTDLKIKSESQNGVTDTKKRPAAPKKEPAPKRKKKTVANIKEDKNVAAPRKASPAKSMEVVPVQSPIFNSQYQSPLFSVSSLLSEPITADSLPEIVKYQKAWQLVDLSSKCHEERDISGTPLRTSRNCCVCLEADSTPENASDMLICQTCRVNVHASCTGITITAKLRLMRQWQCESCINDLYPVYSTHYTCCLCMAECQNHSNVDWDDLDFPDYLIPVLETGQWCHLACAVFCSQQVTLRVIQPPAFVSKEIINSGATTFGGMVVNTVSTLYLKNSERACLICKTTNGALLDCPICEAGTTWAHVTCAQDNSGYQVGFYHQTTGVKNSRNCYVDGHQGRLEAAMVCNKHDKVPNMYSIRHSGKRTLTDKERPLILLFLEDLAMSLKNSKVTGPQLLAHNYLQMMETYVNAERAQMPINDVPKKKTCRLCHVTTSAKWWPDSECAHREPSQFLCQKCHFAASPITQANEGDIFLAEISQPLSCPQAGIISTNDRITNVYKPLVT